jgi:hypothetical protein
MNKDSFNNDITLKPYLKYEYQAVSKGLKTVGKEAFLKAIDRVSNHLYNLNLLEKKGRCFFYIKKHFKSRKTIGISQFSISDDLSIKSK